MWVGVQVPGMSTELPLAHAFEPPGGNVSEPPAVVVLHGRGADERDLLPIATDLHEELAVLSLRAPTPLGPGYTWYELDLSGGGMAASQPDESDYVESLDLIEASIEAAIDRFGLDRGRISMLGFSQGAIMSFGALVEFEVELVWAAALHGYLPIRYEPGDLERAAGTPVFVAAGDQDQVIPATRAEEAAGRLTEAGLDVTFRTYPIGHGTDPNELEDLRSWVRERC